MTGSKGFFLIFIIILKIYTISLSFKKINVFFLNCVRIVFEFSEIQQIFFELDTSPICVLRVAY